MKQITSSAKKMLCIALMSTLAACTHNEIEPDSSNSTTSISYVEQTDIKNEIVNNIPDNTIKLLHNGVNSIDVVLEDTNVSISARVGTGAYNIPLVAQELCPNVITTLERNNCELSNIMINYYDEDDAGEMVDESLVNWSSGDGKTGSFLVASKKTKYSDVSISDMAEFYEKEISAASWDFSDKLDIYQGEWQQVGNEYGRLIISDDTLNFISEMDIGGKKNRSVNTFYFGFDDNNDLIVNNQHLQHRYDIVTNEDGTLTLKPTSDASEDRIYKKISDNTEVPSEIVDPAIGMTENEVFLSSWGSPNKKNTTTIRNSVHEQWVYDYGYIYFEDGIVTSIQEK